MKDIILKFIEKRIDIEGTQEPSTTKEIISSLEYIRNTNSDKEVITARLAINFLDYINTYGI